MKRRSVGAAAEILIPGVLGDLDFTVRPDATA